ncbi:MAG TPA: type 1 glutamine amidotransferase domain-containing protein [Xanthomonadales bacterium]|nr:type 1 glutamine amidotransferase domain-containing protein [Xanthomonadales bacterium]
MPGHATIEGEQAGRRAARRVLVPLPDVDFDPTEVAVPWRALRAAGHDVVFATERGDVAACDPLLIAGVLFGKLGADADARDAYASMSRSDAFRSPMRWSDVDVTEFDALLLPGGHAPGMRQYLGSATLQAQVARFAALERPIGAICHGVLLLARAHDPATGRSVLHARRTTCLPKYMEALAFALTGWKLGRYYRTYPAYVEDEVCASLASTGQFRRGPLTLGTRGSASDDRPAFVVEDGNYVSARWPGDAHLFAKRLVARLG